MAGKSKGNGNGTSGYVQHMVERARELYDQDAFAAQDAPGGGNAIALDEVSASLRAERRVRRRRVLAFSAACLVLALVSLLLPYRPDYFNELTVYSPADVADCCALFFQVNIAPLFDPTQANMADRTREAFNATHDGNLYWQVGMRAALTLLTLVCAWLLSVSGLLFQTTFRNPLAVPSMLGVSDGVTLGYIVFLGLGFMSMPDNPPLFFLCAYGCGIAVAAFVLFSSRFIAGSKTYNIMDMLLIGTVVSQIVGGTVSFAVNYGMDYATYLNYYDLLQSVDTASEPLTYVLVGAVALLASAPVVALRFRMNLLSFSNLEIRLMGAHPGALRWAALLCGGLMQLAAITSIGQVAMVSLAVPFLARYLFPADFRSQLAGNFLVGAPLLLVCQILCHFIVVNFQPMNIGTLVAIVIVPVFVWMMALQRKGWS